MKQEHIDQINALLSKREADIKRKEEIRQRKIDNAINAIPDFLIDYAEFFMVSRLIRTIVYFKISLPEFGHIVAAVDIYGRTPVNYGTGRSQDIHKTCLENPDQFIGSFTSDLALVIENAMLLEKVAKKIETEKPDRRCETCMHVENFLTAPDDFFCERRVQIAFSVKVDRTHSCEFWEPWP